jgi:phage terminase large subunit-like protein
MSPNDPIIKTLIDEAGGKDAFRDSMSEEEWDELQYKWKYWARRNQLPPKGKWFVWMIMAGRGLGKTRIGAEWASRNESMDGPPEPWEHIALIGQTKADCRDTMVELGSSAILNISPPEWRPTYEPSKRRLVWPNGAKATIYSGDEPDQLRGPAHSRAWLDELAKFQKPRETYDNLMMGLRLGEHPRICITTTPRPIPIIKELVKESTHKKSGVIIVTASTFENADNLPQSYLNELTKRYEGTRLGRQELYAEVLSDNPDALWNLDQLDMLRVDSAPVLVRIVVAIDPETSSEESSAETGIIIGGVGANGHGYVIEDATIRGSPHQWGKTAIERYKFHMADRIVAEINQGGDMVEHTLRTIDPLVPVTKVRATKGKYTRAEPISSLYEKGIMHHVGVFPELESQMCSWTPGDKSPDRLDALVWLFTELMGDQTEEGEGIIELPKKSMWR